MMRRDYQKCAVPHCPCLKEAGEVVCSRHFKMVRFQDVKDMQFYVNEGEFDILQGLWRAQVRQLAELDAEFLSKYRKTAKHTHFSKRARLDTPTPLTGGVRRTTTQETHAKGC